MMQEFYIPCDGVKLHTKLEFPENRSEQSGEKFPLLILFHGLTGNMEERHILACASGALAEGYAVLRAEMYGHGKSEGTFKEHTLYKWIIGGLCMVDWAKEQSFVSAIYMSGHSQGGLLSMIVAGMKNDDIKALIPLAPAWMIPEGARKGNLVGIPFDPDHVPDVLSNGHVELDGNYIRTAQSIHVEDFFEKYTRPVLIIQGDADEAVPLFYAEEAARRYKDARLRILPGDDHGYSRHLEDVVKELRAFLREVKPA